MDNKFVSPRLLLVYALSLTLGTYFVSTGIDYFIAVCVRSRCHMSFAYTNSVACVIAGFVIIGASKGIYDIYIQLVRDKMHEAHVAIRDIHTTLHACDTYVGTMLIAIVMIITLIERITHFMYSALALILKDPCQIFFGPMVLCVYGMYLIYRGNKGHKIK